MKHTLVGIVPFAKIQVLDAKTLWFLKFIIVLCPLTALRDSCIWQQAMAKSLLFLSENGFKFYQIAG